MSVLASIGCVGALLALGVRLAGRQHRLLHLFQLEHYEPARLLLWLRRRGELVAARLTGLALVFLAAVLADALIAGWLAGALLLLCVPFALLGVRDWRRPAVKPLVLTGRATRLLVLATSPALVLVLAALVVGVLGPAAGRWPCCWRSAGC